jgi:hypothetical protein
MSALAKPIHLTAITERLARLVGPRQAVRVLEAGDGGPVFEFQARN